VVADVLDAGAVAAVMTRVRPDAVIDELTSLPKDYTPTAKLNTAASDLKVPKEPGKNLHDAARASGVKRYLVQSTGFFYAPGIGLAPETDPLALNAPSRVAGAVRTYLQIEDRVLRAPGIGGVALRYGFFYGPGTYYDPADGSVTQQVREQNYPVIGSGDAVYSYVHVEDAAAATVAALESDPGVYNVVDDDPTEMRVWLPAFATFVGAPAPPRISDASLQPDVLYYAMQLRGARNDLAKQKLGFSPRPLEWLTSTKERQHATT
jgi:nucleoside-diphosphate-sugar epimerase